MAESFTPNTIVMGGMPRFASSPCLIVNLFAFLSTFVTTPSDMARSLRAADAEAVAFFSEVEEEVWDAW